jgi:ferredoxin-NADP reductase
MRYRNAITSMIPVTLLYSSRSWEEIIYRKELDRLSANPATRVIHTLTRSHPDGWQGYTRRIDAAMIAEAAGEPAPGRLAYVCGPTRLVENVANDLVALGYPTDRVKTERFGPTGAGG